MTKLKIKEPVTTTQLTSKKLKGHLIASVFVMIISGMTAVLNYSMELTGVFLSAVLIFVLSAIWHRLTKLLIWWKHK
tara:strand:- start:804 stop:1034 length:231 start_codon:yes stop_codon:yes gene_type:complete